MFRGWTRGIQIHGMLHFPMQNVYNYEVWGIGIQEWTRGRVRDLLVNPYENKCSGGDPEKLRNAECFIFHCKTYTEIHIAYPDPKNRNAQS